MKKILLLSFIFILAFFSLAFAENIKVIPYPEGIDTKSEGASSAPANINHDFSIYSDFKDFVVENVEWGGHWRVIIGYDTMRTENTLDDVLIMADPYDTCDHKQDGYVVNNGEKFFSMWFDHSMLPEEQREQPFIVASPH